MSDTTGFGPCKMCGSTGYALSMGGPSICPSCDCGVSPDVSKLIRQLAAQAQELGQLDDARDARDAAVELNALLHEELDAVRADCAAMRDALKEYAKCQHDGCTCGEGWSHHTAADALAKPSPGQLILDRAAKQDAALTVTQAELDKTRERKDVIQREKATLERAIRAMADARMIVRPDSFDEPRKYQAMVRIGEGVGAPMYLDYAPTPAAALAGLAELEAKENAK